VLGLAGSLSWLSCAFAGTPAAPPPQWRTAHIQSPEIGEASGIVRSRTHPHVLWTHNDSGDGARFFAIDEEGRLLATYRVDGARNVDWEDIAIDDSGSLYLADVGNNWNQRPELVIYRVAEPDPALGDAHVPVLSTIRYAYADQTRPGNRRSWNFDCEAVFWRQGRLFLFSKDRSDTKTRLYAVEPDVSELQQLEPIAEYELGGSVDTFIGNTTAADITPDGLRVALLGYRGIHLFRWDAGAEAPTGPVARVALDPAVTQQAESLTWEGDDLIIGNEQRRLFFLPDPFGLGQGESAAGATLSVPAGN